jgi:hypothetical protein
MPCSAFRFGKMHFIKEEFSIRTHLTKFDKAIQWSILSEHFSILLRIAAFFASFDTPTQLYVPLKTSTFITNEHCAMSWMCKHVLFQTEILK